MYPPPRDEPYGREDFLQEHADLFIERARFHGHYHDAPERLKLLLNADDIKKARVLDEWLWCAVDYPSFVIEADSLTKNESEEVPVRAHYLRSALGRLLELIEAPENMRADVDRFFAELKPRQAKKTADAQAELLRDGDVSISEIARRGVLDRSTIQKLLKAGVLVRP